MKGIYDDTFYELLCHTFDDKSTPQKIILGTLLGGGIVIAGALAPNIFKAFQPSTKASRKSYAETTTQEKLRSSLYHLKKQKYIRILKDTHGTQTVLITAKGKLRIKKMITNDVQIKKQKRWDKQWRIVLFDIPLDKNNQRMIFRRALQRLNFLQLQKSVWVHPYPCEDEILFLARQNYIEEYIEFFETTKLLHEKNVRKYFHL